jgi:RNA polymerase sigma factor (sigma-70 family)
VGDSTGGVIAASTKEATTGDADAFVALVEPVLPPAYRLALAMLHSEIEAEDAVQEAMFKAWRHFGKFRRDAEMKPWLLAIVANECRRLRRNHWSWVIKTADPIGDTEQARPEVHEVRDDLRRALYRLPHDQRLAVILRYYVDLSFEEVGQVLKISAKAAKSRTYRALERLRLNPEVLADE